MSVQTSMGDSGAIYQRKDKIRMINFIFETLRDDPDRQALLNLSQPFLESLDLNFLMKSRQVEEQNLALNLCALLLHHDRELTMVDLLGFDLQARDLLNKTANQKIWTAVNQIDQNVKNEHLIFS